MQKIKNLFKRTNEQEEGKRSKLPRVPQEFEKDAASVKTYLTLLSTDKPIYRPGETVYVRGVILHSLSFQETKETPEAHFKVFAPNGDNVITVRATVKDSVVSAYYNIPSDLSGGDYKLQLTYPYDEGFTGSEREFNIRAFRAPRLKTQLKFLQKGYGPGDKAIASLEVTRAEGGVPTSASITAIATVDGEEVYRAPVSLDSNGTVLITFDLPTHITTGDGTLVCKIQDGGVTETASKTIPILLQTMEIYIYPEGGDLISGVENRFYVEAFTKTKDPGDITAEVRNKKTKEVVAMVTTEHEGRGKSKFVPQEGEEYVLHVVRPSGILNEIPFPDSKKQGVVLKSKEDVFTSNDITVTLLSPVNGTYRVTLNKKKLALDSVKPEVVANEDKSVTLNSKGAQGVLTVTVYSHDSIPLAERLIYRKPSHSIQVEIQPEKTSYTPGDKVKLHVKTTSEGKPISSNVGLQVTDDSVLEMVEKRKQAPRLPAMALLEPEVDHLEDSEELLAHDGYVDLLLGTQGWRRFVVVDLGLGPHVNESFLSEKGIKAERVLGTHKATAKYHHWDIEEELCENEECEDFDDTDDYKEQAMDLCEAPMLMQQVQLMAPMREEAMMEPMREAPMMKKRIEAPMMEAALMPENKGVDMIMQKDEAMPFMGKRMMRQEEMLIMPDEDEIAKEPMFIQDIQEKVELQSVIREFAHKRGARKLGQRTDFTETIYWGANVVTNDKGEATIEFNLSDSVTSFRVFADCFVDTLLGSASVLVESKNPFYMEPKLPLEVSYGDIIQAPIALVNETNDVLKGTITPVVIGTALKVENVNLDFKLNKHDRQRKVVPITVGEVAEEAKLKVSALTDSVTRSVRVAPTGFPFAVSAGGTLEADLTHKHQFTIPATLVPNSFETAVKVFSTPASTLTESLKYWIREPCGCFEQTSMTSYPLVMVLRYFKTHTGVDPKLIESATEMLAKGYKRLTSYECKNGGFEWFGSDPAHEALTAYGVLQFTEMSKVYPVDSAMLERTTKWLLGRRDGKGGFLRSATALDEFGAAPKNTTNAYICWALTEAGIEVTPEIDAVKETAKANGHKDSYLLALLATTLYRANRRDEARFYADILTTLQDANAGMVNDAEATITSSYGNGRIIETTAIAVLSWLNDAKYNENIEKAMKYLNSQSKNASYGSTQSTVLALKAIVTYDEMRSSPGAEGSVIVRLDGKEVTCVGFDKTTTGTIEAPSFANALSVGDHTLEIEMLAGGRMPYTFCIDYYAKQGASSDECKVNLKTELSAKKVAEGETCRMNVVIGNKTQDVLPMTVAILGVPGGLEVRHDQLKEFVKNGTVAFYETKGRDLVLYWRYFKKGEVKEINVDLIAAVPGKYTAAASRAYLYYTNEHKVWNEGTSVEIK